jgi:hypothetical protein
MGGRGGRRSIEPEAILEGHAPAVVALAGAVRALISGMIDGVVEAGDPGARVIAFRRHGRFAFVEPMPDHVRLGFEHGYALPDPAGLLEGEPGGAVRHVALRAVDQVTSRGVKLLVSAALFDDETHGFRRRARQ